MARPRYRRTPDDIPEDQAVSVPVVLPLVVFTVHMDGTMSVTVDGAPHVPAPFAPPWQRDAFPTVLDTLTTQHRVPLRVEVHEADGSTFTDIITPARRRLTPPAHTAPAEETLLVPSAPAVFSTMHGSGFVPGEDVAVAVIISHSDAGGDGSARAMLTREVLGLSPTREVILFGRISGTITVGHPE